MFQIQIPGPMIGSPDYICEHCRAVQFVGEREAHRNWCPRLPPRAIANAARLDEYDETEWLGVATRLKPGLTPEEYHAMWERFVQAKEAHLRSKEMQ
jgi:hypothetical protein